MNQEQALTALTESFREGIEIWPAFITIFNPSMWTEALCCFQLGLAVLMDKPILVLKPRNAHLPKSIQRLAFAVEEFDKGNTDSVHQATERLLQRYRERKL
jgi:hypothetical protein